MTTRPRFRPAVELLETRWVPTVTASYSNGALTLTGDPTTHTLNLVQTAPSTFQASDGATPLLAPVVVSRITFTQTVADPVTVNVDPNGFTGGTSVTLKLSSGTNNAVTFGSAAGGRLTGSLTVTNG